MKYLTVWNELCDWQTVAAVLNWLQPGQIIFKSPLYCRWFTNYCSKVFFCTQPDGIQPTKLASLSNQSAWCQWIPNCLLTGNNLKSDKFSSWRSINIPIKPHVLPVRFIIQVFLLSSQCHQTDSSLIARLSRKVCIVIVAQSVVEEAVLNNLRFLFVWESYGCCTGAEGCGRAVCFGFVFYRFLIRADHSHALTTELGQ